MFAFFFDEDHPDNESPFGPQFASKIIVAVERMVPVPETRLLTGALLHNLLVYEVDQISFGANSSNKASKNSSHDRSQHSVPNYDRRLSIVCDLAETLSGEESSFAEEEVLLHLARKNIWIIFTPHLSAAQARAVHDEIAQFGPYLGYSAVDDGNPLHRRLFWDSLFNDKAIGSCGLAFRRDAFDIDDEGPAFADEYGASTTTSYDAEDFDSRFPLLRPTKNNSIRGDLTASRLAENDPGHRSRVAHALMSLESGQVTAPFSFSARKPDDGIEFVLPPQKFTDYLLNPKHKDGGPKAKFFIDSLGIQPDDWRYLADQILQGAKSGSLYRLKWSTYGASHGALVLVTGRNGKIAVVETGWRVPESGAALFVTAYPADPKLAQGLTPNAARVPLPSLVGKARWAAIHELANEAGLIAAAFAVPPPMVLETYGTIWEGECGFGWVQLPDGRSSFARWIVEQKIGYPRPGVRIFSRATTQSMAKNKAYAEAYAEVLRSNGIDCSVGSRLD